MKIKHLLQVSLLGAASLAALPAQAFTALTAQQVLEQFNLVVLNDATNMNTHVHGRTYVGNNFTGGSDATVGQDTNQQAASNYATMTVRGNATGPLQLLGAGPVGIVTGGSYSNSIANSVHTVVGGATNGVTVNGAGGSLILGAKTNTNLVAANANYTTVNAAQTAANGGNAAAQAMLKSRDAADDTDFTAVMTGLSNQLKGLASTGSSFTRTFGGQTNTDKVTFTAKANADGLAVFNFTAAESLGLFNNASNINEFRFATTGPNAVKTIIFNVDTSVVNIDSTFLQLTDVQNKAIWNFHSATSVTTSSQFGGNILAVNASYTNAADVEGSVVVKNFVNGANQLHVQTFTGTVPGGSNAPPIAAVPEPSSLLLMALSLVGLVRVQSARNARVAAKSGPMTA